MKKLNPRNKTGSAFCFLFVDELDDLVNFLFACLFVAVFKGVSDAAVQMCAEHLPLRLVHERFDRLSWVTMSMQ